MGHRDGHGRGEVTHMSTPSPRDLTLGLLVILTWATNTVAIKLITLEVEPFTGLAIRLAIGSLIFAPFFRWPGKKDFILIAQIVGLLVVLHWGSLIWGIDKLDASMASILLQTQVIFSTLIGFFFFGEKFGWRTKGGIAMGIAGVIVLVGLPQNPPSMAGVASMIFSMMMIASAYARMKNLHGIGPMNYMAHLHILGVLPVTALAFIMEKPMAIDPAQISYYILVPALLFQVIIVGGAHTLWQRLMTRNAMSSLPNLALLLPVFGVIISVLTLGESITWPMIAGGILTMTGVAIIMVRRQKKLEV